MFTVDPNAMKYAMTLASFQVQGYSLAQIEMEAMECAASFFECNRDEIVLIEPSEFQVFASEKEFPYRPKTWIGTFKLAHISVEQRNMVLATQDDDDD